MSISAAARKSVTPVKETEVVKLREVVADTKTRKRKLVQKDIDAVDVSASKKQKTAKSKQKKATGKASKKAKQPFFTYRSNIIGAMRMIKSYKFTKAHLTEIRKTPFFSVVEAILSTNIEQSSCHCYNNIIFELIKVYDRQRNAFEIGGKTLRVRNSDVRLIFGVIGGKEPITSKLYSKTSEMDNSFYKRRCVALGLKRLDQSALSKMLESAINGKSATDRADVARVITLILLLKLFVPTAHNSLGWNFLRYVEDLDRMQQYDWVMLIRDTLMDSIKRSNNDPKKVTGCVMLLLVSKFPHLVLTMYNFDCFLFKKTNTKSI